mmetsp:Transcript_33496/g.79467  ORF Transcript_33496/g.79467 Transcript_33496/m.79467 type:complete len:268 (+) Transcript_33496:917-1720(+)
MRWAGAGDLEGVPRCVPLREGQAQRIRLRGRCRQWRRDTGLDPLRGHRDFGGCVGCSCGSRHRDAAHPFRGPAVHQPAALGFGGLGRGHACGCRVQLDGPRRALQTSVGEGGPAASHYEPSVAIPPCWDCVPRGDEARRRERCDRHWAHERHNEADQVQREREQLQEQGKAASPGKLRADEAVGDLPPPQHCPFLWIYIDRFAALPGHRAQREHQPEGSVEFDASTRLLQHDQDHRGPSVWPPIPPSNSAKAICARGSQSRESARQR